MTNQNFDYINTTGDFHPVPASLRNPSTQLQNILARFNSEHGETLRESDPRYLLLETVAGYQSSVADDLDSALRQGFLSTATGAGLDALGNERGVRREPNESDDAYRVRIVAEPYTRAAPATSVTFEAVARSASADVRDVAVDSRSSPFDVYILSTAADGVPTTETLDTVRNHLESGRVGHIGDMLTVQATTFVRCFWRVVIYYNRNNTVLSDLQTRIDAAIEGFIDRTFYIEFEPKRFMLESALDIEGVTDVQLTGFGENPTISTSGVREITLTTGQTARFLAGPDRGITYRIET